MAKTEIQQLDGQGVASVAGNALGDQPTLIDRLNFTTYVEAIARFLKSEATRPPISISIEGDWGSGKSSFLLQLESAIGGAPAKRPLLDRMPEWLGGTVETLRRVPAPEAALTVRFNAWRHDKQDALWAAFALAFVKSLRSEVGLIRAWQGDIYLFLKRLKGLQAWLELILLVASVAALVVAALFVRAHPLDTKPIFDWLTTPESKQNAKATAMPGAIQLWQLASGGTFGGVVALGVAGVYKFHSYIRMPLSLKLERYLSRPDYEGHASFIETFHRDLNRLVEAYAGTRRVFIFIDDLDRCDVPRAADLMQAINLMIGDSSNLVFIIGMDREKVAAGIAQKYKNILPFLRESAQWKPNDEKDNYTPLYFGYGYLEKFIQISFSLTIPNDEAALDPFLREEIQPLPTPAWHHRFWNYWNNRFSLPQNSNAGGGPNIITREPPPPSEPKAAQDVKRIFNRLKIEQDSDRIYDIVKAVSGVFEYNPRRLKQFINTFRLSLYIASDQGLFDQSDAVKTVTTPEQIGKCVALLLRFPDLRYALERDSQLLSTLQQLAFQSSLNHPASYHWLAKPGTVRLLTHECKEGSVSGRYSLAGFDVSRLFSVLPRAPAPPDHPEAELSSGPFDELVARYEDIRAGEPASPARTRKMTALAKEAVAKAQELASPIQALALLGPSSRPGARLMRILIAFARKDAANLPWLVEMNGAFVSPFEHYWCIRTLIEYVSLLSAADRAQINVDLVARWNEIKSDPGRAGLAGRLRDLTGEAPSSRPQPTSKTRSKPVAGGSKPRKSRIRPMA